MSGPKVINLEAIRRRQQRESISRLRTLHDTLAEWQAALTRAGLLSEETLSKHQTVLQRLDALRKSEDWPTLLAEIPARIDFLRAEIENANHTAIQHHTARRERFHRLARSAAMLQREWQASGHSPPPELDEILSSGAREDETSLARLESMLNEALRNLPAPRECADGSAPDPELIAAFRDGTVGHKFREWLDAQDENDPLERERNRRLASAMGEVQLHASGEPLIRLLQKSRLISMEQNHERRAMLADSLLIEADELCRSIRQRVATTRLIRETIASFEPFESAESAAWVQRLESSLENPDPIAARELANAARAWLLNEAAREDAKLRREAVLRGLTALGYEVRENMATAWAENGRVIVRKPQEPDYGIELKSPPAGEAVQARVVAFSGNAERSASEVQRDREVEQTWCGEFQKMRELLLADGFTPALLHAEPAGEIPIKVEPQSVAEQRDLRSIVKPNQAREERT